MVKINPDLVYIYSQNSREKIKTAAGMLSMSSQRVKHSLKVLRKEEIISNPYCIFDYSYFGLILFRVYFKGGYISEKDKQDIITRLAENPYIVSMYELSGEFDLAIELESPNPSRFNKELKKVATLIPTLNNYKMILNIVTHIYPKSYLPKNAAWANLAEPEIIIGGDRSRENFSQNELLIMKHLLNNPQIRLMALARSSGMNIKTSSAILKNLQERRIIRGFRYLLGATPLDLHQVRLFLKLHNLSQDKETELMKFMAQTKEIVAVNKTVGDWDMEVDIESMHQTRIRQLIVTLRENFKELIESFNSIEFYQYYKRSYLPRYLFQKEESS